MTITVDCVVTSMTKPANPTSNLTYQLWNAPTYFDFSQDWVQDPACGYAVTDSFVWTGLNSYITQDSITTGRIAVDAVVTAAVGTHTVSVQNTPTIASNGANGSESFAPANAADKVEFTITIEDPCRTTTVNTITITGTDSSSPYSKGVQDTATATVTFVRPTTTAEDSN